MIYENLVERKPNNLYINENIDKKRWYLLFEKKLETWSLEKREKNGK